MTDASYTTTFTVDRTPEEVFDAINDVRGWWIDEVEGTTASVGDEFTYRVTDVHLSTIRVTELVPGETVVWTVLDNYMSFVEDQTEWIDTEIRFELSGERRRDRGPVHPRRTRPQLRVLRRLPGRLDLLRRESLPPGRAVTSRAG